ncbi:NAD(P)/FAD-dependent oxidoreductase [Algoriphagus namhaensis]
MLSYWEKKNFQKADLLVIGAGFVGLSTALHFKLKNPASAVLVLERGIFPTGASSKNAGFACFGSLTEILDDLDMMSENEVLALVERRFKGLRSIRREFGDEALDYKDSGGFELLDERSLSALDRLGEINDLLRPIFDEDVFSEIKHFGNYGFGSSVKALVRNRFEGELDPGRYLSHLWQKATQAGVKILTGVEVAQLYEQNAQVQTRTGVCFQGGKIAVCTNAFTTQLLPQTELKPGRGLILLSERLDFEIPWQGSFHLDKGYVYFRQIDGRLLLGGGRNMDFTGEEDTNFEVNPIIKRYLNELAREIILPERSFEWEMEWTGIMGFGASKAPIVRSISPVCTVAVRLGGMGVAIGWQIGKEHARLLDEM